MQWLGIFIAYPLTALVPAAVFVALCVRARKMLPGVVAVVWAAYAAYEYLMHVRVLCTGECNIRVDLLLIYPILLVLTLAGLLSALRRAVRTTD